MTDKKKHKHEEKVIETEPTAETMSVDGDQPKVDAEREALQAQLAEAESKASEYKDGWARSQAEFQNYKKRIERDNELTYASMKGDIVKKFCLHWMIWSGLCKTALLTMRGRAALS